MKIFIAGGTGVVGRRLVPLLCEQGHQVTGVVHTPRGRIGLERQGARPVNLNLFDPDALRAAVVGHEVIVNLATHIPHSAAGMFLRSAWRENDRLRQIASAMLADTGIAADVPRFLQESFAPAYPDCGDRWIDETTPLWPVRYNRTLADAEASADRFSKSGRTGVVLRFGAFYGPDAFQTAEMLGWVKKGWAPIPGSPGSYVSSVSHDDAATAVAAALTLPGGTYNVVDDEPVTHRELFDSMADALGVRSPRFLPPWAVPLFGSLGEMFARSVRVSNHKFRAASGWAPRYASVRQGWPHVVAPAGVVSARVPEQAVAQQKKVER